MDQPLTEEEEDEIWARSVEKWKQHKEEKRLERERLIAQGITPPEDTEDDEWQNLPIFMQEMPQGSNPMVDALQAITDECTPEELCDSFKEQGNERYQLANAPTTKDPEEKKRYRNEAIYFYNRALDAKCKDMKRNSMCLSNRAAVNMDFKNYGRVIQDCIIAIEFYEGNVKAYYRALKSMIALAKYDDAVKLGDRALAVESIKDNKEIKALRDEAATAIAKIARRKQEKEEEESKKQTELITLAKKLATKKMTLGKPIFDLTQYNTKIWFDDDRGVESVGEGHFPTVFLYPEFSQKDYIVDFQEGCTFGDHLEVMFEQQAPWDKDHRYRMDTIEVYFQTNWTETILPDTSKIDRTKKRWIRVKHTTTIDTVLSHPEYIIPGIPIFYILSKDSKFAKKFLTGET
ncbi:tetratricopeptide repeat domain 4 [Heterostelium album PN500]|uniref:Tetratricopeptide repeat domain 4 n=1 Tax=Heterostelium pallidum (strain ATCC 26659 / Pp 5 / PN500) TaxID=670386 RepID=D3AXV8_HETP5|nr:tetratricopeptide repeat domain 4 [Heterostelium album PN500]EFA85785.1 tetratricopeptide repeat domain 4 [Heterostelium album PN500]|eukprot:XP_020437891.1 tetratricopeptide repeat domain 4 [Heterostelium album PN500]